MQKRSRPAVAHQVRIIGGRWKRTPLPVLTVDGLRPTPDRVRETVFNWLGHLLDGNWTSVRCLDLFAGTGALGFEAASRGAAQVLLVEQNTPAARQLEAVKAKLQAQQVTIVRADGIRLAQNWVERGAADMPRFELIFVDPPYHQQRLESVLPLCAQLLAPGGIVYVETEAALEAELEQEGAQPAPAWLGDWEIVRADRAGSVFYHLLQCKSAPEIQA